MRERFSHDLRRNARAFTLLEILVATSIFSVLLGALYTVLRGGFQLRETAFETVEWGVPRDYVATLIRRDLSSVVPPVGLLAGALIGEKTELNGQPAGRLEFYAASGVVRDREPWGDVQRIEYYLAEPDEETTDSPAQTQGLDLVRAVKRNLLEPIEQDPEEQRLLSGVRALTFEYYDAESQTWQETWDSTTMGNTTPTAVRMRIEFMPAESGTAQLSPIELVCEIVSKPREAEAPSDAANTGGGTNTGGGQ